MLKWSWEVHIVSGVARFLGAQAEQSQWPPIKEMINFNKITLIKISYIRLSNLKYVVSIKFIFALALKIRIWTIETFFRLFNDIEEMFDNTNPNLCTNVSITPTSK
jgi:hypothetical protein